MRAAALAVLAALSLAGCAAEERAQDPSMRQACTAPALAGSPTAEAPWFGVHATLRGRADGDRVERALLSCNLGVQVLREDLEWELVQPAEDAALDFSAFDAVARAAARRGLTVLPILDGIPSWAGPVPQGSPVRADAYAAFAAAAVARYGPDGTFWDESADLPRRPATWWEHGNEVYLSDLDAARYARGVVAGTAAMRAADPDVRILVGAETDWTFDGEQQANWLGRLFAADDRFAASFDALSVHPYSWPDRPQPGENERGLDAGRLETMRADLVRRGMPEKHLWVTEIGWPTCRQDDRCVSPADQARFLEEFVALRDSRWREYVDAVLLYQLQDGDSRSTDPEMGFGVLDDQGRPKPAWDVFGRLARRAAGRLPTP